MLCKKAGHGVFMRTENNRYRCQLHNQIIEQQHAAGLSDEDLELLIEKLKTRKPQKPQEVPAAPNNANYNQAFPSLNPWKKNSNENTPTHPVNVLQSTNGTNSGKPSPKSRSNTTTITFEVPTASTSTSTPISRRYIFSLDEASILGSSKHSTVFAGECQFMGIKREIAIKRWSLPSIPSQAEHVSNQLENEYKSLAKLSSSHVVRMIHFLPDMEINGGKFALLVMERCKSDLLQYITIEQPALSDNVQRAIINQLLEAYQHIHSAQVRHLDVKPENILVDEVDGVVGPHIKLCDFAFSQVFEEHQKSQSIHSLVGTVDVNSQRCWISPEVINTELDNGAFGVRPLTADIWSLGCVLYFIATKTAPFKTKRDVLNSKNEEERLKCLRRDNLHTLQPLLYDLVEKMTRYEPEARITLEDAALHPATWSAAQLRRFITEMGDAANTKVSFLTALIRHVLTKYLLGKGTLCEKDLGKPRQTRNNCSGL